MYGVFTTKGVCCVIVDGTKNNRIGFIQPAGGKSSEVVGNFQSFIQQADAQLFDIEDLILDTTCKGQMIPYLRIVEFRP